MHSLVNFRPGRPEFPSWVPDWAAKDPHLHWTYSTNRDAFFIFYKAWDAATNATIDAKELTLSVNGICIDTICAVGRFHHLHEYESKAEILQEWRAMSQLDQSPEKKYITGEKYQDAFARTLIGDIIMRKGNRGFRRARAKEWSCFNTWWAASIEESNEPLDPETEEVTDRFTASVAMASGNRAFFITRNGYMGTGPPKTAVGDEVFVVKGSKVPFVLCPATENKSGEVGDGAKPTRYFNIVGDCYCHGAMDGEVVKGSRKRVESISLL